MRRSILAAVGGLIIGFMAVATAASSAQQTGNVTVNGQRLDRQSYQAVASAVGNLPDGKYWYDHATGFWGYEGGPAMGNVAPGIGYITAPLRADASGGMTRVFLNGRAIHPAERQQLIQMYGHVADGRYKMDSYGRVALEGQPFPPLTYSQQQRSPGGSVYMPGRTSSGAASGLHVGQASDGCTYIVTNGYSAESC